MDRNTVRVLEIDGGGERGYLPLQFFRRFVQQWGVDPTKIAEQFDVICGTSVGGIMALSLAFGLTPDEMVPFFTTQGPYIFSLSSVIPSLRPNLAAKLALIATNTPFYQSSGATAENYGSGLLYKTIQTTFGTNTLQDLKTNVIIPTYKFDTQNYILCSNLNYPEFNGRNELISNVAIATGSAPIYLPSLTVTNSNPISAGLLNGEYIDGGVYQNNPAQFGVTLGKMVKPNANRFCILSLGTGIGELGFDPGNPDVMDVRVADVMSTSAISFDSIETIFSLFEISSTGGQESVSKSLSLESLYTLDQTYYYRFQPQLDPNKNTELDNTDPDILVYYEELAEQVFNNDNDNISTFIGHLTA